jgi:hypothetical protein
MRGSPSEYENEESRSGKETITVKPIPEFPNELGSNAIVAIDIRAKDGTVLRWVLPEVQQARVMAALGRMAADIGVAPDFTLPDSEEVNHG